MGGNPTLERMWAYKMTGIFLNRFYGHYISPPSGAAADDAQEIGIKHPAAPLPVLLI
jgi:hypothetical protein